MAKDAGTKQDQPSDQEGQGPDPKVAQDAADAKAAQATEQAEVAAEAPAAEDAPKPKRKRAPKQADGTAAATTDVDKPAAEAGATGAEATADASGTASDASTQDKPKPKRARGTRGAKPAPDEAPAAETKPAPTRRRDGDRAVTVRAHAKYVRVSARKARLVADHFKGKDVNQARAILAFSPRSVAEDWRKVLESAIANAEHNHDLVGDDLRVLNATADEGPTLKRFRPRAMGRATKIRKRTSHLTITLTPKD
jgi:ribosomal protein L22